jgi:four helix bundle protein
VGGCAEWFLYLRVEVVSGFWFKKVLDMATITKFEDIIAWQKARVLCQRIFEYINRGDFARDFKLRDQINSSSGSVMDNIAEGFERDGKNEFRQFLSISKASCGEVQSQLYRALDRNYLSKEEFQSMYTECSQINKMIAKLMQYLNASEHRGNKFKEPDYVYGYRNEDALILPSDINDIIQN